MTERPVDVVRLMAGLQSFAAEMREKGIHVGMGKAPRCVTCGDLWPCSASTAVAPNDGSADG